MKPTTACLLAALLFPPAAGAATRETPGELLRQGYQMIWHSSYENVEICTPENPAVLSGGRVFACYENEFPRYRGTVYVMSRTFYFNDQVSNSTYLCLDDEGGCIMGDLSNGP